MKLHLQDLNHLFLEIISTLLMLEKEQISQDLQSLELLLKAMILKKLWILQEIKLIMGLK